MKRHQVLRMIFSALLIVTTLSADTQTPAKRPDWVIMGKTFGYGVGFAPKSEAGLGYQRREAIAQAEIDLARSAQKRVSNMIDTYFQSVGIRRPHIERVTTQVSRIVTDMMIGHTRLESYWFDRDGTLYVLIHADPSAIAPAIKRTIARNESLRQTLHAKEYHRTLDRVIDRFFADEPSVDPAQKVTAQPTRDMKL